MDVVTHFVSCFIPTTSRLYDGEHSVIPARFTVGNRSEVNKLYLAQSSFRMNDSRRELTVKHRLQ